MPELRSKGSTMAICTILVSIDGTEASRNALQVAFAFARSFETNVGVLHVQTDPKDMVPLLGEGMSVAMIEDMIDVAERERNKRADIAKSLFEDTVSKYGATIAEHPSREGFSACWILENGREDDVLTKYGRLADIIVVPRPTKSSDVSANLNINAALFESGRAVLMVPPAFDKKVGGNVVVSWNGSVQSARAVRASISILEAAADVTVITVEGERVSKDRGPELASYLGWHGIFPKMRSISGSASTVGPRLIEDINNINADLLVMGAYTHSRMRQLILGGVTRHILESADIPVFMAH